jgi:tRNA (Thr-GGU) A37 N-methylase
VGVFADRGPRRPNRIGATLCRVLCVRGRTVQVRGLDAVRGSPILDLKPALRQFLPTEMGQPGWVDALMREYFQPWRYALDRLASRGRDPRHTPEPVVRSVLVLFRYAAEGA